MAPGRFTEPQRAALLSVARASVQHGLKAGQPLLPDPAAFDPALAEPGACFLTLHSHGRLRGCIGSLEAHRPLLQDVAQNAFASAFRDPRFAPLDAAELDGLELSLSVLSAPQLMQFVSETDLKAQLRPAVDGLILQAGARRGTFLPAVWEALSERDDFLRHLKLKAGLDEDYWSDSVQIWRYTTESFSASF
jgi:AmmeMemoRadiSam system protein A